MQQVSIARKIGGGVASVDQGKTAAMKDFKGKCHGCGMVNGHFLPDCKVVSEESKEMILAAKR